MRIYRGRIEPAIQEIAKTLVKLGMIEVSADLLDEVRKDLESVLTEYQRMEREINERAKDLIAKRGLTYSSIGKLKRALAQEKNFKLDDDALDYIVEQMIEIMFSSAHVEEVFGEDHDINRIIAPIMRKHMSIDDDLDKEVRQKIKHLQDAEGTMNWEFEYSRVKADLERLKKLK